MGAPTAIAATDGFRSNLDAAGAIKHAFGKGQVVDTGATKLWTGPGSALNGTLDKWLLNRWSAGAPLYGSLFFEDAADVTQVRGNNGF